MSKFTKLLAAFCIAGAAIAAMPNAAMAQRHHGGGGWHGGGGGHHGYGGGRSHGWRGGGWGPGFVLGFGAPAYYYGSPYSYGSNCGYTRVRVWRNGHWVLRRAWRCY